MFDLTLDVGCGSHPRGDVNVDVNLEPDTDPPTKIDMSKTPNFILCDGQHLPFKPDIFKRVTAFHVIEHIPNPLKLLRELHRVANGEVEIRTPHRLNKGAKNIAPVTIGMIKLKLKCNPTKYNRLSLSLLLPAWSSLAAGRIAV